MNSINAILQKQVQQSEVTGDILFVVIKLPIVCHLYHSSKLFSCSENLTIFLQHFTRGRIIKSFKKRKQGKVLELYGLTICTIPVYFPTIAFVTQ